MLLVVDFVLLRNSFEKISKTKKRPKEIRQLEQGYNEIIVRLSIIEISIMRNYIYPKFQ